MLRLIQTDTSGKEDIFEIIDKNNKPTKKGLIFLVALACEEILADIFLIILIRKFVLFIKNFRRS